MMAIGTGQGLQCTKCRSGGARPAHDRQDPSAPTFWHTQPLTVTRLFFCFSSSLFSSHSTELAAAAMVTPGPGGCSGEAKQAWSSGSGGGRAGERRSAAAASKPVVQQLC